MNNNTTQIQGGDVARLSCPATSEDYIYYDSEINGNRAFHMWNAYHLTQRDMRCIFEELESTAAYNRDGEEVEIDFKVYHIVARHEFDTETLRGGDHYCGLWETVEEITRDRFEVVDIYDEQGNVYDGLVRRLNDFAKNRKTN